MLWERAVAFTAGDDKQCSLTQLRGERKPDKGPVLLVHGAGVRSRLFRPPTNLTLAACLVEHGYDVWLEDWRASIEFLPNQWTLDQAAAFDHPKAVETVCRETGSDSIKAIIHCQGSTSFMMAAVAGLLPQVDVIVSNAVSLHPVVPEVSAFKLNTAVPLLRLLIPYLNPQWGIFAPGIVPKLVSWLVNLTHRECANPVCKQVSFTYGTGFPTLWDHENLNDATHEWIKREFGHVPLRFFSQMAKCVRHGNLVSVEGLPSLPADFAAQPPRTDARIAFLAGERNHCFLPESQRRTYRWFDTHAPGKHSLHVLPGYGHLDVFIGKDAARDVFPLILEALEQKPRPTKAPEKTVTTTT